MEVRGERKGEIRFSYVHSYTYIDRNLQALPSYSRETFFLQSKAR